MKTYLLTDEMQIIGRAGEQDGIVLAVDVSDWQEEYSDGVGTMLCTRPDGKQVPISCTLNETLLKGELPDECLSRPGVYQYTANWVQAGVMRKSQTYKCIVLSTAGGRGLPPECKGTPAWATEIFVKAEQIDAALDAALQMAERADDAEAARDAALAAQEAAEDAQEAAEDAKDASEYAQAQIETMIEESIGSIEQAQQVVAEAQEFVNGIEQQKDTMIASIASVAGQGTDTTLTQTGVAADAKATGNELSGIKGAICNGGAERTLNIIVQGAINTSTGINANSTKRVRTSEYVGAADKVIKVIANAGYTMLPYAYDSDGTFVGFYAGGRTFKTGSSSGAVFVTEFDTQLFTGYKFRFMFKNGTDTNFTPANYGALAVCYPTDTAFVTSDVPADAAQIGDYMARTTTSLSGADQLPVNTSGYIVTSGETADIETVVASSVWTHLIKEADVGETYYITGVSGTDARLWAFVDKNGNVLECADADLKYWNKYIEAPEQTAYIIVHSYKNRTILYNGVTIRKQVESRSVKLHLCAWNIGNYNYGRNATTYPRQNGILKSKLVREFIRDEFPDILVLTEFYHINLTDGTTTIASKDDIKTVYRYYFKRNQLLIASNWPITNGETGLFTAQAEEQQKEWSKADIFVKSKKVTIISAHFASGTDYTDVRQAQYQEIITMLANTDSAIILGDFNSYTIGQMVTWTDAGYTILNGGYNGIYPTCPAMLPTAPLDNIVLKGNNIYGVGYPHKAICDPEHDDDKEYYVADHLPFMADVVIS